MIAKDVKGCMIWNIHHLFLILLLDLYVADKDYYISLK